MAKRRKTVSTWGDLLKNMAQGRYLRAQFHHILGFNMKLFEKGILVLKRIPVVDHRENWSSGWQNKRGIFRKSIYWCHLMSPNSCSPPGHGETFRQLKSPNPEQGGDTSSHLVCALAQSTKSPRKVTGLQAGALRSHRLSSRVKSEPFSELLHTH